jgi:hypothetical protein
MAKNSNWVSLSELHEITSVDRATIRKRLAEITPRIGDRNAKLYDKSVALTAILASAAVIDENSAKERKLAADAEKAELVVKKLRGELVSVDSMKQAAAELIKTLYARTVRVEPSIIAPKCIGKSVLEIETIIRETLSAVFNELKTMPESFLSVTDDGEITGEEVDESGD